ncbi:MAG: DNA polymerase Y family protein [Pyrinomonadaceae bacterium]
MFACIYGQSVSKFEASASAEAEKTTSVLVGLAFEFSPLVEETSANTVLLDIAGQGLLFGVPKAEEASTDEIEAAGNLANAIAQRASALNLNISVAVAVNPDVAIHAARSFSGVTVVPNGGELSHLQALSIKTIDCSLVEIDVKRAQEIQETLALWGIRTFGDLARLPLSGIAERLGQDGVQLQKLAQGKTDRRLNLVRPPIGFAQSLELEHPVCELEPLSFILSRLLNQLCANLHEYALATNELKIEFKLEDRTQHQRAITLPVPMRNPKTLLRLLLFDIEARPPQAPVVMVTITAEPVKPRAAQTGLFIPLAPEPEKLEITLARLAKLVGLDNVGSPEVLDTHRPDAFRMKRFKLDLYHRGHRGRKTQASRQDPRANPQSEIRNSQLVMGFRMFRPAWRAEVQTEFGKPTRVSACSAQSAGRVRGVVICAGGPWRASGEWWRQDVWARDEWDVAVIDPAAPEIEILCRVYRDLASEQWFVAGVYD